MGSECVSTIVIVHSQAHLRDGVFKALWAVKATQTKRALLVLVNFLKRLLKKGLRSLHR